MKKPEEIELEGKLRDTGRKAADALRDAMRVPAVMYGPEMDENITFSVEELEVEKILSESKRQIINLKIDGTTHRTILKAAEFHPVTDRPIHIDLYALAEDHKVTLTVPIRLEGIPIGVRDGGGRVYQPMHILHIKVLPKDIPGDYTVDVTDLEIGENLHVRDLDLEGIIPLDETGQTIITVRPPKAEELLTSSLITEEPSEEELEEALEGEELPEGEEAPEGEAPEGEEAEGEDEEKPAK